MSGAPSVSGDDAGEALSHRAHLFVCTHMKRDARCGVCGPALIESIRDELKRLDIADDAVAVRGCSHTGGHKYAGNLLLFVPEKGLAAKVEDAGRPRASGTDTSPRLRFPRCWSAR